MISQKNSLEKYEGKHTFASYLRMSRCYCFPCTPEQFDFESPME
jgi:hypothetical protein